MAVNDVAMRVNDVATGVNDVVMAVNDVVMAVNDVAMAVNDVVTSRLSEKITVTGVAKSTLRGKNSRTLDKGGCGDFEAIR